MLNPAKFLDNLCSYYTQCEEGEVNMFSDFSLVSNDGRVIKVHKIILASQSEYFKGMLRLNPLDTTSRLPLPYTELKLCIDSLYTGRLPDFSTGDDGHLLGQVLIVADFLGIEEIINACSDIIISQMSIASCCKTLVWSGDHCLIKVKKAAENLIAEQLKGGKLGKLKDDLLMLPKEQLSDVLLAYTPPILTRYTRLECKIPEQMRVVPFICRMIGSITSAQDIDKDSLLNQIKLLAGANLPTDGAEIKKHVNLILVSLLDLRKFTYDAAQGPDATCSQKRSLEEQINRFMESFILEDILNATAECGLTFQFLESFFLETFGSCYYPFMLPPVLRKLKDPQDNEVAVVDTQISPQYGFCNFWTSVRYKADSVKLGIIRKVVIYTRYWDQRIVIKGFKLYFQNDPDGGYDKNEPVKIGLEDSSYILDKHSYKLKKDEYISFVVGRCGWMLDQITFVTNLNRKLGPVGGTGGRSFFTSDSHYREQIHRNSDSVKMCLRGIQAVEDGRIYGSSAVGRVRFISTVICKGADRNISIGALVRDDDPVDENESES